MYFHWADFVPGQKLSNKPFQFHGIPTFAVHTLDICDLLKNS